MADPEGGGWEGARAGMVRDQLAGRGVKSAWILEALGRIPRECFVPPDLRESAYEDHPLPIGHGQTISQPYIVAFMVEALALEGCERVLEVGSGSGYAAAVLAERVPEVWGIDLEPALLRQAQATLEALGRAPRIHLRCGDGAQGWPEAAPFGAILVSCATPELPPALILQVADGGRIVFPEGTVEGPQHLIRLTRQGSRWIRERLLSVRFVPLRH